MNMEHSWILIVAMIGHILCVYADRLQGKRKTYEL